MRTTRASALATLLLGLVLTCSGCAVLLLGGAAAGGTYVYLDGWSKQTYKVGLDQAYNATLDALQELKMPVEKRSKGGIDASVTAKDLNRDVWIKMEMSTERTTVISIRVGLLGDEVASKRIHTAIGKAMR